MQDPGETKPLSLDDDEAWQLQHLRRYLRVRATAINFTLFASLILVMRIFRIFHIINRTQPLQIPLNAAKRLDGSVHALIEGLEFHRKSP
ncbi:hypothetical protein MGN70_003521 [Eutypa lata]|nr:hypothetical protein MGN70_003521 [Eutypa lata]